jgi:hypothetical protein
MIMPSFVEDLLRNQFKILSENPRPLRRMQKVILVLAFLFLSLTIMVKVSRSFSNPYPIEKDCYPVDAVNYMKQNNVKGNLLVNFNWAQYMIWEMYPACKVCYDGRHRTIYPLSIEKEYFKFHFMNGEWDRILDSYPPDFIIWQADMPHAKLLKDKIEWEEIYADKEAVILRRKNKSRL